MNSSPGGSIVANRGRCYNDASWTYYSIDTCIRQEDDSSISTSSSNSHTVAPTSTSPSVSQLLAPASSTSVAGSSATAISQSPQTSESYGAPASSTNTGAIAGGVVGGLVGLAIIIGGVWFFLRRRRGRPTGPWVDPSELSGEHMVEISGKPISKAFELPEARVEAYAEPPPQELSTDGAKGIGVAKGEKSWL